MNTPPINSSGPSQSFERYPALDPITELAVQTIHSPSSNDPKPLTFLQLLRAGTQKAHEASIKHPFNTSLMNQTLGQEAYVRHLTDLKCVFEYLENILANSDTFSSLYDERLNRTEALQADLISLQQPDLQPSQSALDYCEHLKQLGQSITITAHIFSLYFALFYGGQIIAKKLPEDWGRAYYRFESIEDLNSFKTEYRKKVDALIQTSDQKLATINEALDCYERIMRLMDAAGDFKQS